MAEPSALIDLIDITIPVPGTQLIGHLRRRGIANRCEKGGLVVLAQSSPRSGSPDSDAITACLNEAGLSTLVINLLSIEEGAEDEWNGSFSMDLALLSDRMMAVADWLGSRDGFSEPALAFFAGGATAAAVFVGASQRAGTVRALVAFNGRADLVSDCLDAVRAPTLLLAETTDEKTLDLQRLALDQLGCGEKELVVIPRSADALDTLYERASGWFLKHLAA